MTRVYPKILENSEIGGKQGDRPTELPLGPLTNVLLARRRRMPQSHSLDIDAKVRLRKEEPAQRYHLKRVHGPVC